MKFKSLLLISLLAMSTLSVAAEIPLIGDIKADNHQLCGKNIDIQIRTLNDDSIVIGLMNNKTHTRDLFKSQDQNGVNMKYAKLLPVRFDQLSKNFIAEEKPEIEIIWGNSINEKNAVVYNLALGPQIYQCGLLQKWPNEAANVLYGEAK